jgi:hypothetical protein
MDVLRSIEFTDALVYLHKLIGSEVKVNVNFYGRFFGCGFEGVLTCVETLPPDHSAISLVLDGRQGFFLDPADTEVFAGIGDGSATWLEFREEFGASIVVERGRTRDGSAEAVG